LSARSNDKGYPSFILVSEASKGIDAYTIGDYGARFI
jgi:hypothetical protein